VTPVALILAAVAVAGSAAGCGAARTVEGAARAAPAAVIGMPVRDGVLEFDVYDVSQARRVGELSDPGLSISAEGVYVIVVVSVRNMGGAAHTFVDRDQTLIDSRGERFAVSMAANIYGNLDVPSTRIAPGEQLVVDLAFDVPVGTVPSRVVLRESASSDGVTVLLP